MPQSTPGRRSALIRSAVAALASLAVAAGAGAAFAQDLGDATRPPERLVARDGSRAIRLVSQRVAVTVEDGLARTTVRQSFTSGAEVPVEAVWTFPVPDGAALVDVAMETDGKRFEGLLAERRAARRAYDRLVRRNIDPALVEQVSRNAFRMSVFPVVPGKQTVVECTWVEACPLERGEYRYVYPLALAGGAPATERDFTFSLTLRSSAPIVSCASDAPGIVAKVVSPTEARASFERTGARLDRDVVVTARVAAPEASLAVKTFRSPRGETWYAAVVTPPDVPEEKLLARDVTLVLDTSGSMEGQKMEQARSAALWLVDHLRPRDRVNVILFSSELARFAAAPVPADAENRARLRAFLTAAQASGATALGDAVRAVSEIRPEAGRVSVAVLLTDGRPTAGVSDPAAICAFARAAAEAGSSVYAFGVGDDVDGSLVEGVAAAGRGSAEVFRAGGETESRLKRFLTRTSAPVMAGLRVSANGRPADDLYPRAVGDLYLGEQAVLTGRIAEAAAARVDVEVCGTVDGREVTLRASAPVPERGGAAVVRDLYARQKLAYLGQAARLRAGLSDDAYFAALDRGAYSTSDEIVRAMIDVSIDAGVQCPYTSFLVLLPEDRARLDPRNLAELEAAERRAREARGIAVAPEATPAEPTARHDEGGPPEMKGMDSSEPLREVEVVADHDETDNESEGDPTFVSDAPFEGPGAGGTIGIGGGAGGQFGNRRGGRANLKAGGGGRKSQNAVDLGFDWWAKRANADGGFGDGASDAESTGLALLALVGAGETHQMGQHKDVVRGAAKWLKDRQDADGCFTDRARAGWMRGHLVAAIAMTELYGMTQSPLFRESAERAVAFAVGARLPGGGWGAGLREGAEDPVLTAYGVLACHTAALAGTSLDVPPGATALRELSSRPPLGKAPERPAEAAALALVRIFTAPTPPIDPASADLPLLVAAFESRTPSAASPGVDDDPEYVWMASLVACQLGGETWTRWQKATTDTLLAGQIPVGVEGAGGWPARGGRGAFATTAYSILAMETAYRYSRVVGTGKR